MDKVLFCKQCGNKIEKNFYFCAYCGTKISIHKKSSLNIMNILIVSLLLPILVLGIILIYRFPINEEKQSINITDTDTTSDNNLFISMNNGYYGIVDRENSIIIDFQFESIPQFDGNYAVVQLGGNYGVINLESQLIIKPMYNYIRLIDKFIQVKNGDGGYGLYDYTGRMIIDTNYEGFVFLNNGWILAKTSEHYGSKTTDYYDLFDNEGLMFTKNNAADIAGYRCDKLFGFSIILDDILAMHCGLDIGSPYGISYPTYLVLIDTNLNLLSNQCYESVGEFSSLGYATAETGEIHVSNGIFGIETCEFEKTGWVVINNMCEIVCTLPSIRLAAAGNYYDGANEYYAYAWGYSGTMTYTYSYAIVNLRTQTVTKYATIDFIDGTNCIIVSDIDTGLYGLYDGENMVADCLFTNINYGYNEFTLVRGNVTQRYIPVKN